MSEHSHVTMQIWVEFVLLLPFLVTDVRAQTAPVCPANSITIRDKKTGGPDQCQECRVCPAGEGLSVNCGDVITPQTSVSCQPCVLGETYSSANEAGSCKDCENCGEYRETTKACTLTSKAVCGKCKPGAYPEFLLGMCKPCSPCCDDGKDIVVPRCQVPGVPANMQCSFLRSEKCRKVAAYKKAKASVIRAPHLQISTLTITPSTSTSTLYVTVINDPTPKANQVHVPEQVVSNPPNAAPLSKSNRIVNKGVIGGVGSVVLVLVILFLVWYRKNKGKQTCGKKDMLPVPETGESPERVGIEDSQPPGSIKKDSYPKSYIPESLATGKPRQPTNNSSPMGTTV